VTSLVTKCYTHAQNEQPRKSRIGALISSRREYVDVTAHEVEKSVCCRVLRYHRDKASRPPNAIKELIQAPALLTPGGERLTRDVAMAASEAKRPRTLDVCVRVT